jgi:hypothetical protein
MEDHRTGDAAIDVQRVKHTIHIPDILFDAPQPVPGGHPAAALSAVLKDYGMEGLDGQKSPSIAPGNGGKKAELIFSGSPVPMKADKVPGWNWERGRAQ